MKFHKHMLSRLALIDVEKKLGSIWPPPPVCDRVKKIGNAQKNIICTALGPFQLRLGLVRLGIDTPPPLDWGQNAKG